MLPRRGSSRGSPKSRTSPTSAGAIESEARLAQREQGARAGAAGEERRGQGTLEGRIATRASGDAGFGFDPVFIPQGEACTVAELGDDWKAKHSHRANAARALLATFGR